MERVEILVVSHGGLAEGAVRAARMIAGRLPMLHALCLDEESSIDEFRERLTEALCELAPAEQLIVLADIQGGSPFTQAVELLAQKGLAEKSFVATGVSLPLLLALVFQTEPLSREALLALIGEAREGTRLFEAGEDEEEDL